MIEFINVSKIYGKKVLAVNNLNLKINKGEFVCFIGTSGSGKTTSMRLINKMESISKGKILLNNKDVSKEDGVKLRRKIGYVIQQIGLMPHMTILDNINIVPKLLGFNEEEMNKTALELVEKIGLDKSILEQYPSQLSGGMQQRIGVVRALAANQELILMDEPFGALDPITRETLQRMVKRLQKELNKTIVFVTHDMDEALLLADKIVVMDKGEAVQIGSPKEILTNPANDFVRDLIGEDRLSQSSFQYESVEKIMLKDPVKINENARISDVLQLIYQSKVDDILVVDDNNVLKGRVDMFTLLRNKERNNLVKDIKKQVTYILNTTTIRDSIYYLKDLNYRNISVVNEQGQLVGLVTRSRIIDQVYGLLWQKYQPDVNVENELALLDDQKVLFVDEAIEDKDDQ